MGKTKIQIKPPKNLTKPYHVMIVIINQREISKESLTPPPPPPFPGEIFIYNKIYRTRQKWQKVDSFFWICHFSSISCFHSL